MSTEYEKHRLLVDADDRKALEDLLSAHQITDQRSYRAFLQAVAVQVAIGNITPSAATQIKDFAAGIYQSLVQENMDLVPRRDLPALPAPSDRRLVDQDFVPAYNQEPLPAHQDSDHE